MDLVDFRQRRRRTLQARDLFGSRMLANVRDVTIRDQGDSSLGSWLTITPTPEGMWRAEHWESEFGHDFAESAVTSQSLGAALDWAWWRATRGYFRDVVVPASEQADRKWQSTHRLLMNMGPADTAKFAEGELRRMRGRWADDTTSPILLAVAAIGLRLLEYTSSATAMRVARNPRTPSGALGALRLTRHPGVRWQLAGNPATSPRTLRYLSSVDDFGVRWHLALRASTPTADVAAWAHSDPALWSAVLDRDDASPSDLDKIDIASSGAFRVLMIVHPAITPVMLSRFARECDISVGIALLEAHSLPLTDQEAIVDRASEWSDWSLGRALWTRNLHLDPHLARRLAGSTTVAERMLAAASTELPRAERAALAADPDMSVRAVSAATRSIPPRLLAMLAKDDEPSVRAAAARNPLIRPELLRVLVADEHDTVRRAAASNPARPLE
jgi:hypothetical protein